MIVDATVLHYACIYLNQDRDLHKTRHWQLDAGKLQAALEFGERTVAQRKDQKP